MSHWYPCFGLLVMSVLGFKARVDPLACMLHHLHCNRILRFTSGVTPADLLAASMAAESISSTYLWAGLGGAQNQDLPTELCWLGLLCAIFIGYKHFGPCGIFCPVIRTENTGKPKSHFSIYCQEDFSQVSCIKKSYVSIQGWLQSDVKICVTRMRYDLGDLWF